MNVTAILSSATRSGGGNGGSSTRSGQGCFCRVRRQRRTSSTVLACGSVRVEEPLAVEVIASRRVARIAQSESGVPCLTSVAFNAVDPRRCSDKRPRGRWKYDRMRGVDRKFIYITANDKRRRKSLRRRPTRR